MTKRIFCTYVIVANLTVLCCFVGCQEPSQKKEESHAPVSSKERLFRKEFKETSSEDMTILKELGATADSVCGDWFYVSNNPTHAGKIITDYQPYSFKPDGSVVLTVVSNTVRRVDNGKWHRTKENNIIETEFDYGESGLQIRRWRLIDSGSARIIFWKNATFGYERSENELYVKRESQDWNAREKITVGSPAVHSDAIDPMNLTVGETYCLSSRTPLMPEFDPADAMEAISRIRYLSNGSVIKVIEKKDDKGTPWYRVQTNGIYGWINSIALLRQRLTKN